MEPYEQKAQSIADKLRSDLIGGALICDCGKCGLSVNKANKIITKTIAKALEEAVMEEREECRKAVVAEHLEDPTKEEGDIAYDQAVSDCEKAILARSKRKGRKP